MIQGDNNRPSSSDGFAGGNDESAGPTSGQSKPVEEAKKDPARDAKEHKVHQSDNVQPGGSRRWTDSLKQVYDPVLNEPIPDSIMDLLSKLDTDGKK